MPSNTFLNPSEAARQLGVSPKALRLYEKHGLLEPVRTEAGWRTYGPTQMARASEIVALRGMHLSMAQIATLLAGDQQELESALADHERTLEGRIRQYSGAMEKTRALRTNLAKRRTTELIEMPDKEHLSHKVAVSFELPWPWGGETFEMRTVKSLNYIVGPLGSGKTRFAQMIARVLPNAEFLDMDRVGDSFSECPAIVDLTIESQVQFDRTMEWLMNEGAIDSPALRVLIAALEQNSAKIMVIDMVEQGLDHVTQEVLISYLRSQTPRARPLFLMTRSSAILDLSIVEPDETVYFCPPNHAPPFHVNPYPGAEGYEALASCLASPDVRARTEGVVACRP